FVGFVVMHGNPCALGSHRQCDGSSNAASCTGHEAGAPLELHATLQMHLSVTLRSGRKSVGTARIAYGGEVSTYAPDATREATSASCSSSHSTGTRIESSTRGPSTEPCQSDPPLFTTPNSSASLVRRRSSSGE